MANNKTTPRIRFKGFTEAWEQRKVGDFLTLSKIPGHSGAEARKLTVKLWGKGVVEKTDIYGGSENTQYYIRHAGQFMYGKLDFLHAAFGIVPQSLDGYESTLDSPAFDLHGMDGRFLLNKVTQEDFYLKNGNIANGSRKAKRVHEETFLEMSIDVPVLGEQEKIGSILNNVDSLITLHQRKLELLKNAKQSLLEKMFPKNGSSTPEIRFKGFTEAWEQCELKEIGTIATGSTPPTDNKEYYGDKVLFVSPGDIQNQRFITNSITKLSYKGFELARKVPANSVLFVCIGSTIGKVGQCKEIVATNQQINSISPFAVNSSDFVFSLMETITQTVKALSATQAVPIVNKETFSHIEVAVPNKNEQGHIGYLFLNLDNLITLHQRKLELLKNAKQSLLEKMFP